jgi:NADP-dependent 3-hydroxy acid dehydrogenase YdfG
MAGAIGMRQANSKDPVVTGVSTGIGLGTTKVLVSKGYELLLRAKPSRLDRWS